MIEVSDLIKKYDGRDALKGISLKIINIGFILNLLAIFMFKK